MLQEFLRKLNFSCTTCLFVSRVGFCHCLINVSIFSKFPIAVNLPCEPPCGVWFRDPAPYQQVTWRVRCEDKVEAIATDMSLPSNSLLCFSTMQWCQNLQMNQPIFIDSSGHNKMKVFLGISQWLLLGFFVQKVLEENLNFSYQKVRNQKNKGTKYSIFKTKVILLFLIFYLLVPRIKLCLQ